MVLRVLVVGICIVLTSCGGSGDGGKEAKAAAIEKAYKSGVLSENEYKEKLAALNAAPKAAAIEKAYKDGVLSKAEYEKKFAALKTAPAPAVKIADSAQKITLNPTKSKGKTYRHPTGFTFWYPGDWKFQMLEGIVQLVPPDSATTAKLFDCYYVTGEDIRGEGITHAQHPGVVQYLQEQMAGLGQQLGVSFRQVGQARELGTKRRAVWDWQAESRLGTIHARTMVTIMGNYGGVIACVGVKDRLALHKALADRIFGSIDVGQPAIDRSIVGTWTLKNVGAVRNDSPFETSYSRAKAVNEQTSTLTFAANGRWERVDDSHMIAGAGGVWLEDKSHKKSSGTWNADGKQLFMMWEDKSFDDCQYRVADNKLIIVSGKERSDWAR